jgi:hypothetical protein
MGYTVLPYTQLFVVVTTPKKTVSNRSFKVHDDTIEWEYMTECSRLIMLALSPRIFVLRRKAVLILGLKIL